MMCYRDKTFCNFYLDCEKGDICGWALTPKIRKEAKELRLPIARFLDKPRCFEDKHDN